MRAYRCPRWIRNLPAFNTEFITGERKFKCRCGRCHTKHFSTTIQTSRQATYVYGMLTLDDVQASALRNERHVYKPSTNVASIVWK